MRSKQGMKPPLLRANSSQVLPNSEYQMTPMAKQGASKVSPYLKKNTSMMSGQQTVPKRHEQKISHEEPIANNDMENLRQYP